MKFTRSLYIIIVLVMSMMLFCGCQTEPVAGEEMILTARQEYVLLDSARVDVINDETGESEQIFIFKYDEKDMMTYSYIGIGDGLYIAQYNNGYEQFTDDNGVYSFAKPGDDNFAAYSRDIPYPYADEGLILFYKSAVNEELSYIAENDMATEICHVYNIEELSDTETVGTMTGFCVKYFFDGEGNLLYLKEITDVKLDDGTKKTYSYSIYITERNAVDSVPNVVKIPDVDPDTMA